MALEPIKSQRREHREGRRKMKNRNIKITSNKDGQSCEVSDATEPNNSHGSGTTEIWVAIIQKLPTVLAVLVALFVFQKCFSDPGFRQFIAAHLTSLKTPWFEFSFEQEAKVVQDEIVTYRPLGEASQYFVTNYFPNLGEQITLRGNALRPILTNSTVLWLDDHPEHNNGLRRALEQFGIKFDLAASSKGATNLFLQNKRHYDAVISNVNHGPGETSGGRLCRRRKFRHRAGVAVHDHGLQ
jgi:hypothetical protein